MKKSSKIGNGNMNSSENFIISGARKRNKKVVFDPSDNNLPKRKRNSTAKSNLPKINAVKPKKKTSIESRTHETDEGRDQNNAVGGVCSVCRHQKNDKFISCQDCCNKAHIGCLDSDIGLLRLKPDNTWQCPYCKTCVICEETADSGKLTVCKICSDAYHSLCHSPKIKEKSITSPRWICVNCEATSSEFDMSDGAILRVEETMEISHIENNVKNNIKFTKQKTLDENNIRMSDCEMKDMSIGSEENLSNPTEKIINLNESNISMDENVNMEKNVNMERNVNMKKNETNGMVYSEEFGYDIDPMVPDARNWTKEDVYRYFVRFFPDEAIIFKNEEVDGMALLLMTRENILQDLQLKIGTALKIYRHVAILQERRDNPDRLFL